MGVVFNGVWQVVLDHVLDIKNIEAAGCYVGCHHDIDATLQATSPKRLLS